MFKINRKVEYALISLKHMTSKQPGQLTSAKEICSIYGTPFDPTSRVLQLMAQQGIIKAELGAHGGYMITKDLSKFTFNELVNIITGPIHLADCFHGNYSHCELTGGCNVIAPMLNLNERMSQLFKTISVQELIASRHATEKQIKLKPLANTAVATAALGKSE